jgi:hypothetical protein
MLSLPVSYVSRRGPNVPADDDSQDVRFLESCPNYPMALQRAGELRVFHPNHTIVVFRVTLGIELRLDVVRPRGLGDYPEEPADAHAFGYAIYAAPKAIVNDDATLCPAVTAICNQFGQGNPSSAGPHVAPPPTPPPQPVG